MLLKGKCPPTPEGWEPARWRKHWSNAKRAEYLTGVVPMSSDGWEKVAVILMDHIQGKSKRKKKRVA